MMERPLNLLRGCVRAQAQGAAPQALLNAAARAGIEFWDAEPVDACTLRLSLRSRDFARLAALAPRAGCELIALRRRGAPVAGRRLLRRRILFAGLLLCALLLALSSLFVWEIDVVGAENLSEGEIRRALASCGVEEGAFWPAFSNELIRNEMLLRLPQLRWMTVNVSHSRAEVLVRERTPKPALTDNEEAVNVVSRARGIIRELDVWQGLPLVQVGDSVLPGDVLVSGVIESLSGQLRFTHSLARIEATTYYELTATAPLFEYEKSYTGEKRHIWRLKLGKEQIKISLGSRKSVGTCDTLINVYPFSMDGVFTLPLGLVCETQREYELVQRERSREETLASLEQSLLARLDAEMGGWGEVVEYTISTAERDGYLIVTLRAECAEDIAQQQAFDKENVINDRDKSSD